MKKRAPFIGRRFQFVPAIAIIAALLVGCKGYGGGWMPPAGVVFPAQATMGFTFSCERSANTVNQNPPTGRLHIELAYVEHGGTLPVPNSGLAVIAAGFGIHGVADVIDPVLESAICIGQNPPPDGQPLIFLGRYRLTSSAPAGFPASCVTTKSSQGNCRFEVQVKDNDMNHAPSAGDYFSIQLSTQVCTTADCLSQLPAGTVFYSRAGLLGGGNLTVTS
jgi:hypothetical protein